MLPSYALLERQSECQVTPPSPHNGEDLPRTSQSLRGQVKKWFAPGINTSVKLTRHDNPNLQCVRAELISTTQQKIIFFFRHPDGEWRVFPPRPTQPTMRACLMAA